MRKRILVWRRAVNDIQRITNQRENFATITIDLCGLWVD